MKWWGWLAVVAAGAVGFYAGVEVTKAVARDKVNSKADGAISWLFGQNGRYTENLQGIVHQFTGEAIQ